MAVQTAPATAVKKTAPAAAPAAKAAVAKAPAAAAQPAKAPVAKAAAPAAAPKPVTKAPAATAPDATGAAATATKKKPAVERTIEEELEMAVNGTLEPRKERGTPDQESLLTRASNDRPIGRPKGITTGLTIQMAWQYLFQQNEKAPANPAKLDADGIGLPGTGKMTDPQITAFMKREFPGRANNTFSSPAMARRLQNGGQATRGIKPKIQSQAWGEDSQPVPASNRGEGLAKANAARAAKKAAAEAAAPAEAVADDEEVAEEEEATADA
jgi:hypothetical protein